MCYGILSPLRRRQLSIRSTIFDAPIQKCLGNELFGTPIKRTSHQASHAKKVARDASVLQDILCGWISRASSQQFESLESLLGGIPRRLSTPLQVSSITATSTISSWTYRVLAANTTFIGAVFLEIRGEAFQDEQGGAEEGENRMGVRPVAWPHASLYCERC